MPPKIQTPSTSHTNLLCASSTCFLSPQHDTPSHHHTCPLNTTIASHATRRPHEGCTFTLAHGSTPGDPQALRKSHSLRSPIRVRSCPRAPPAAAQHAPLHHSTPPHAHAGRDVHRVYESPAVMTAPAPAIVHSR